MAYDDDGEPEALAALVNRVEVSGRKRPLGVQAVVGLDRGFVRH